MISWRPLRGSSSRSVLLLALVAVAGLLPGPASAAPEDGLLVVEGRGGTTVDVRIDSRPAVIHPVPQVLGGGDYAGALVEPLVVDSGWRTRLGAVVVRAFSDVTSDHVAAFGAGQLPPGTYRVTLLGDGPVRVAWSLREADPGVRVVPTRRIPVRFLGRAEPLAEGRSVGRVDLPRALPAGRRALQVLLLAGEATGDVRMCATTAGSCDGQPPVCLPSPTPCAHPAVPEPYVNPEGRPNGGVALVESASEDRALRWSFDGYRLEADRLRAAAIIF